MRKGSNTFPSSESITFSLDLEYTENILLKNLNMEKFSYMVLVFKWNIINIQINSKNYYMYMQKNLIFFLRDQAGCTKAKIIYSELS